MNRVVTVEVEMKKRGEEKNHNGRGKAGKTLIDLTWHETNVCVAFVRNGKLLFKT